KKHATTEITFSERNLQGFFGFLSRGVQEAGTLKSGRVCKVSPSARSNQSNRRIRMNRRDFLTVVGGGSVVSFVGFPSAFAAEPTTTLYLHGLVMVSFEEPVLRIGFPKAPGHKATLKVVPLNGAVRTLSLKGHGGVESHAAGSSKIKVSLHEAVNMSELYG